MPKSASGRPGTGEHRSLACEGYVTLVLGVSGCLHLPGRSRHPHLPPSPPRPGRV